MPVMPSKSKRIDIPDLDDFATKIADKIIVPRETKVDEDALRSFIKTHTFDVTKKPPENVHVLYYNGVPIGSRGNIVTITGPAKSRKTVVMSGIASAFFMDHGFDSLGFTTRLDDDDKILHIDTEQSYHHYYETVCRIFRDAGKTIPPHFHSLHTRDADIKLRIELTEYLLQVLEPAVLFIDGITDYIYDINSQEEAVRIGEILLRWTYQYNCLCIAVIHTTKSTGFMTGAIGTYLEKKCETAIKVTKPEDNEMISDVTCQYARGPGFKAFSIELDKERGKYVRIDDHRATAKGKGGDMAPGAYSPEVHAAILARVFQYRPGLPEYDLKKEIISAMKLMNGDKLNATLAGYFVDYYNENALIIRHPDSQMWMRAGLRKIQDPQRKIFHLEERRTEPDFYDGPTPEEMQRGGDNDDLPF